MKRFVRFLFVIILPAMIVPTAAQETCGSLPARLQPGQGGRVLFTDGSPLNVRVAPGRSRQITSRIPEGEAFTVLEGPVCADNLYWWRITTETNGEGWIAEGADGAYFVEAVSLDQLAAGAALAQRLNNLDSDTTLVLMENGSTLLLADPQLAAKAEFSGAYNPIVSGGYVVFLQGEGVWFVADVSGEAQEITPPLAPEAESLIGVVASVDGKLAWLFQGECNSTKAGIFMRRDAAWQICSRAYTLLITSLTGNDPRRIWHGQPHSDATNLRLEGWRDDGGAVFLRHSSSFAFPEPGSDPNAQQGYAPRGSLFLEIELDGAERERVSQNLEGALSPDGRWVAYDDGARFRLADAANTLIVESEDGASYQEVFTDGISQLDFSPDSRHFVWADLSFGDDYMLTTDVMFKTLDLSAGDVMPLRAFSDLAVDLLADELPQAFSWLADDILLVRHHGRIFALDVTSGGSAVWRLDLPDGVYLLDVILP